MSANNQIVVVEETNGTFSVWHDYCVDDPFPTAASCIGAELPELEALRLAFDTERDAQVVEYGVIRIKRSTLESGSE